MAKRSDWSRPLPQPLQIIDENEKPIITLKTLSDVRKMLLGLPEPYQLKTTWGHVRSCSMKLHAGETSWMSWCRCAWCWVWRALRHGRSDRVQRQMKGQAGRLRGVSMSSGEDAR